jgi:glucose 1-dehydrogenase
VPLGRPGSPEIVADNVLHLLRQDFVTGAVVPLDGGQFL